MKGAEQRQRVPGPDFQHLDIPASGQSFRACIGTGTRLQVMQTADAQGVYLK